MLVKAPDLRKIRSFGFGSVSRPRFKPFYNEIKWMFPVFFYPVYPKKPSSTIIIPAYFCTS